MDSIRSKYSRWRYPVTFKEEINDGILKGINDLHHQMSKKGSWQCFETLAGTSDEWVTAFIGSCLASLEINKASELAERAYSFLCGRRFLSAGWGFNKIVPPDADSTAWVIRLGECLQKPLTRKYKRGIAFLQKHAYPSGGIATYRNEGPIRLFTALKKMFPLRVGAVRIPV